MSMNPEIRCGTQLDVTIDSDGCICPGPPAPPDLNCNEHGKPATGWHQGNTEYIVAAHGPMGTAQSGREMRGPRLS
jgi:hypothetical protein